MRWKVRDAEPGAPVRRDARQVATVEDHPPAVGLRYAEQAVEERGLARAVRTDQPDDLAFGDVEADVVERGDARERLRDSLGDEQAHEEPAAGATTRAESD